MWSRHSRRIEPITRSTTALALGARTGVMTVWMPIRRVCSGQSAPKLRARPRIRKRGCFRYGVASISCRHSLGAVGCRVTLMCSIRHRLCEMNTTA